MNAQAQEALRTPVGLLPIVDTVICGKMRWHVERMGEGPPCLLIHGTGSSCHSWRGLMPLLAEHYSVMAIDLPGHGRTGTAPKGDSSLPTMAALTLDFLDTCVKAPVVGIGHSAGAAILAQMGLAAPDSVSRIFSINGALVPLEGLSGILFPPIARLSARSSLLSALFTARLRNPERVERLLANTGSVVDPQSAREYHALCQNASHIRSTLNMMAQWRLDQLLAGLHRLKMPVCLVASSDDPMVPLRQAYRALGQLQQAELKVIAQGGHLLHEEQPHTVADIILDKNVRSETAHRAC